MTAGRFPSIRRLSDHVIDLIAAGEVVERPASALKELVENAIDAGSTRIEVVLRGGGAERIDVTDDGCGMTRGELELAVQRHCTSKLEDDRLVRIRTLGFRGEALPSIGASARLSLTSRVAPEGRYPRDGEETAWRIRVEGGVVTPPEPASGPVGTRVVVTDLFFATPARRKFLKSARVENGHAENVMRRLALCAPHCAMRVTLDDRVILDLPAQSPVARAAAVLDAESAALLSLDEERNGARLSGFIAGPALTRATGSGQFVIVNGRAVTDPMLRTAIRVAYRPVIEHGRFPVMALHLTVPVERLDVNVHPAKTELRFADEAEIRSLVIGGLGRALSGGSGGSGGLRATLAPRRSAPAIVYPSRPRETAPVRQGSGFAEAENGFAPVLAPSVLPPAARAPLPAPGAPDPGHPPASFPPGSFPLGAAVAQVFDTYLIAVAPGGDLILVDQHAAHERLTHEKLRAQYAQGRLSAQALLLPEVIDLPRRDAEALLARTEELAVLGIDVESFGPLGAVSGSVLLRSVPALLGAGDAVALLRDVADELASDPDQDAAGTEALSRRMEAVIARMACHGSIRAGRRLKPEEMDALLREMERTPRADTCPHGRPTWLRLTRTEIERLFGRVK